MTLANLNIEGAYVPDPEAVPRLVCIYTGEAGEGKTHSAFTAPGPIVVFDVDHGLDGVVQKFLKEGKEILVIPVDWPATGDQAEYRAIWNEFEEKWEQICDALEGTGGTLILDTMTELVELAEWAFVGKLNEIPPTRHKQYQAPLRGLVRKVLNDTALNAIFIHKWGQEYNGTGYEIKGYKDMQYQVQAVIHVYIDEKGNRMQECVKSRANPNYQGADPTPALGFERTSRQVWQI